MFVGSKTGDLDQDRRWQAKVSSGGTNTGVVVEVVISNTEEILEAKLEELASKNHVVRYESEDSEREINWKEKLVAEGKNPGVMKESTNSKIEHPLAEGYSNPFI